MYKHLVKEQRYTIERLLPTMKQKKIAEIIGVKASTVCRELGRNSGKRGYTHKHAQELADERKERLPGNRAITKEVMDKALDLVRQDYSPEQVSETLSKDGIKISHTTIYNAIHKDKENGGDLYTHCRNKLKHRKRQVGGASCKNIPNRVSINQRPPEADGKRFGDLEMDTIVGPGNKGAVLTMTDRSTNFVMMARLPYGKKADEVAKTVVRLLLPYKHVIKTITTDNGSEFAAHELITAKLGIPVYFADPYCSWQKGAIEHANKLIRQYIPKETDLRSLSSEFIYAVQKKLNARPREKLGYKCPRDVFFDNIKKLHLRV